jgi:hypothetical protein
MVWIEYLWTFGSYLLFICRRDWEVIFCVDGANCAIEAAQYISRVWAESG